MTKKTALVLLTLFDLFAFFVFWLGYDEVNRVFAGIAESQDAVSFSNRVGFYSFFVIMPILHLFLICYHFFLSKILKNKTGLINLSFTVLAFIVFGFSIYGSNYVRIYVERAGYHHCLGADESLTFVTYLVYVRDDAVCHRFVDEKKKGFRAAYK